MPDPRRMTPSQWLGTIGGVIVIVMFLWNAISGWHSVLLRLHDLERKQEFSHGDVTSFLKE